MSQAIPQIIRHFTDDDLYKFTMCCAVIENYPRTQVKYRFTDRSATVYPPGFADEPAPSGAYARECRHHRRGNRFHAPPLLVYPGWFYSFLKGFRYKEEWVRVTQDAAGHLAIEFEGCWSDTILLEVKVLAIVSELYYIMTGKSASLDYDDYYDRSYDKARRLIEAGCVFSDFGTRRRASFRSQDTVVRAMKSCTAAHGGPGAFIGTSNVYFAMKYDLTPVGTMAHEPNLRPRRMYGPQMANHLAMKTWSRTYRGALGTFLYDTYGWRIFSLNFSEDYANMFKGLRVDSGDNKEQI